MKIKPGEGNTIAKMTKAIETHQQEIKVLHELIKSVLNVFNKLGLTTDQMDDEQESTGGLSEINVNTTIVTDGTNESTLRDAVYWDPIDQQWKFYAVFKPVPEA